MHPALATFADPNKRQRLTPTALKAILRVMVAWQVDDGEAATLVGVPQRTWARMKNGIWSGPFSQDQLTRASAIIGLYKALHLLFADGMADRWPNMSNNAPLFAARSPVQAMILGGIPHMIETRLYVDALCGVPSAVPARPLDS